MLSFNLNWLAILISAVANMIIGAVWYGVLANPWLEGIGKTREWATENQRPTDYIIAFVNSLLMAFFLANVMVWANISGFSAGIMMGFFMWLGFTGFSFAANHAFEGRTLKLWAVNSGIYLVGLMVMGAILGLWQ
ncbi:MAG: DUF1761 domain-containing protein [Chloroflexi bacterium]|nr:DUF1761 domain-containing protein [Chloroflexota bacterium]